MTLLHSFQFKIEYCDLLGNMFRIINVMCWYHSPAWLLFKRQLYDTTVIALTIVRITLRSKTTNRIDNAVFDHNLIHP